MGNENIYMLTSNDEYMLRIELEDFEGNRRWFRSYIVNRSRRYLRIPRTAFSLSDKRKNRSFPDTLNTLISKFTRNPNITSWRLTGTRATPAIRWTTRGTGAITARFLRTTGSRIYTVSPFSYWRTFPIVIVVRGFPQGQRQIQFELRVNVERRMVVEVLRQRTQRAVLERPARLDGQTRYTTE